MKFNLRNNLWLPYNQMKVSGDPIEVAATNGVQLHLADGTTLIDGIASWWTACHGYNHPHIVGAVVEQIKAMPHVMMGGIVHSPVLTLSRRLAEVTLGADSMCFFSESGSVAVEVALKIAVQSWLNRGVPNRQRFACFQDAYHGDTTGAMSVCDAQDSMHAHFKGFLIEQYQSPIPQSDRQRRQFENWIDAHHHQLAGVIIEPLIQMAAGMRMHAPEALAYVAQVCRSYDLLLIADEVATGFGRTGSMFAFQQSRIAPDILCLGKGLTGGTLPLAATVASGDVYQYFHSDQTNHALMHGPTFMGNPTACAAANASLDLFEENPSLDRLFQVQQIETMLVEQLRPLLELDHVIDVRIKGALGAVQMDKLVDVDSAMAFFRDQGVFIRPLRDVVYLAPSFTIEPSDLEKLCLAVKRFVAS